MSSVSETTMVTRIFSENDFFIPSDSLLPPASDDVNIIINLLLIIKLLMKIKVLYLAMLPCNSGNNYGNLDTILVSVGALTKDLDFDGNNYCISVFTVLLRQTSMI